MISVKNVILRNKPLSNLELEDVARKLKIPYFRGVFLFGRMSDAKTKDTGVSLTYINNNYIRSDGGTPFSVL